MKLNGRNGLIGPKNTGFKLLTIFLGAIAFGQFVPSSAFGDSFTPKPKPADRDSLKPHAGIILGAANPNGKAGTGFNYGADVGIQPYIPFGMGLQLSRFATGNSSPIDSNELSRTSLLAKATYNFGGDICIIQSSYVGLKTGAVFDEFKGVNRTHFGIGPMLGFDHPVTPKITLGLELAYLAVLGDESPDSPSLNGAIKYWF